MIVFNDLWDQVTSDVDPASYPSGGDPSYAYFLGTTNDGQMVAASDRFDVVTKNLDVDVRILTKRPVPTGDQQIRGLIGIKTANDTAGRIWVRMASGTVDGYMGTVSNATANEVQLWRVDAGAFSIVADADRGLTGTAERPIRLKATGTATVNLEFEVQGVTMVTGADSGASRKQSGPPGIGGFINSADNSREAWVRQIQVDDLRAAPMLSSGYPGNRARMYRMPRGVAVLYPYPSGAAPNPIAATASGIAGSAASIAVSVIHSIATAATGMAVAAASVSASRILGALARGAAGSWASITVGALRAVSARGETSAAGRAAAGLIRPASATGIAGGAARALPAVLRVTFARGESYASGAIAVGILRPAQARGMAWSAAGVSASITHGLISVVASGVGASYASLRISALRVTAVSGAAGGHARAQAAAIRATAARALSWCGSAAAAGVRYSVRGSAWALGLGTVTTAQPQPLGREPLRAIPSGATDVLPTGSTDATMSGARGVSISGDTGVTLTGGPTDAN